MSRLILTNASVGGAPGCTVVVEGGLITEISRESRPGVRSGTVDAGGGAVLPALWDHHVHLFAAAARAWSVDVAGVRDIQTFIDAVQGAVRRQGGRPVRVVGYDDKSLGPLDGQRLDRLVPCGVPVRVQHRSGHQWVLNSAARLACTEAGRPVSTDGIVWGQDAPGPGRDAGEGALRSQRQVSVLARQIAAQGCAGVTDMSATSTHTDIELLRALLAPVLSLEAYGCADGGLPAVKRIAGDHQYPDPDEIASWLRPGRGRVAVHTVTTETLALILAAGAELGPHVRLEHVFMASGELLAGLSGTGVQLGVHPGFIHSHGDRVLGTPAGVQDYQPLATMRRAGFRMFGGTDRPYGPGSVWQAMESAVTRRTRTGVLLGGREFLTPEEALALFTRDGLHGDAPVPAVRAGQPADFCVLDRDWKTARSALSRVRPVLTVTGGIATAGAAAAPGTEEAR